MVWPAANVNTTNADAGTDSPAAFRDDVLDLINKFNQLRAHPSPFIQGLLDDIDAAAARATLGAASTTGNESIDGSKSFVKGVGVAGQAADETGWTLTGYLRGLLLPATRAIWWAKGAASRSIGIVRQSGSNLLRVVSSTADDGTAAAFDALTVDAVTGDVVMGGAASANSAFLRTDGGSNSGVLTFEKPGSSSTLNGNVQLNLSVNDLIISSANTPFNGARIKLGGAPTNAAGDILYVTAQVLGVNGYRKWSDGVIEQWGTTGPFGDIRSGAQIPANATAPLSMSAIHFAIANPIFNGGEARTAEIRWNPSGGAGAIVPFNYYESAGVAQAGWSFSWYARGIV